MRYIYVSLDRHNYRQAFAWPTATVVVSLHVLRTRRAHAWSICTVPACFLLPLCGHACRLRFSQFSLSGQRQHVCSSRTSAVGPHDAMPCVDACVHVVLQLDTLASAGSTSFSGPAGYL
jgi:hypothetical protein